MGVTAASSSSVRLIAGTVVPRQPQNNLAVVLACSPPVATPPYDTGH